MRRHVLKPVTSVSMEGDTMMTVVFGSHSQLLHGFLILRELKTMVYFLSPMLVA